MTLLPHELRPWQEPLRLFAPEVRSAVGPWLAALRAMMGPIRLPRRSQSGDSDGIDGLSRRGTYERLLLTEWAVALDAPDEFLRRAAMGEHVFLAPAFQEPHGARTSIALLDCGPSQLGAPRLAQLALLVVMHQRATDGGARFVFGSLSARDPELRELDRSSIPWWLEARTWASASTRLDGWVRLLEETRAEDLWIIGGPESSAIARQLEGDAVRIEQPIATLDRILHLQAQPRAAPAASIALRLPDDRALVSMFRAPLAPLRRPDPMAGVIGNRPGQLGQLSLCGRRLFLPRLDRGVNALHVPSSVREQAGRTKQLIPTDGACLIGADLANRRAMALSVGPDERLELRGSGLQVEGIVGHPHAISTVVPVVDMPASFEVEEGRLVPLFVMTARASSFSAAVLDHGAQLWRLRVTVVNGHLSHASCEPIDRGCGQVVRLDRETFAWTSHSSSAVLTEPSLTPAPLQLGEKELGAVAFARPRTGALRLAYVAEDGDVVLVGFPDGCRHPRPGPAGRIIGLMAEGVHLHSPVALWLAPDGLAIRARGDGAVRRVYASSDPIVELIHYPSCDRVVARTNIDEIFVYDLRREQVVLRVRPSSVGGSAA